MSAATTEILLGVDVGTSRVKALAVALDGSVLATAERATPWRRAGAQADLEPEILAQHVIDICTEAATDERTSAAGPVRVLGIGFTGMAETGVLLDAAGQPCAPALAWHDPRGDMGTIEKTLSRSAFQRTTGLRLNSKPSLSKILWLQANIPTARAAVRHLTLEEWLVRRLGGEEIGELSLGSRTGMYDIAGRKPWVAAEELLGRQLLPAHIDVAGTPAGHVDDQAPQPLRGAVLTVAGHDHQTAAFMLGAARDGALFDSLGTAEALLRTVAEPVSPDRMEWLADQDVGVGWGVVPDHQCVLAGLLTGLSLERIAALLGLTNREQRRDIGVKAAALEPTTTTLRLAAGGHEGLALAGIADDASPELLWRVAVDELTAMCAELLGRIDSAVGPHTHTTLAGGWLANPAVSQAKARQFGSYTTGDTPEAGAVGAAFMAGIAAGVVARPAADEAPQWSGRKETTR